MGACNPDSFRLSGGDRSGSSAHAASYHGNVSMCHQPVFAAGSGTRWVSHQTVAQFMFAPCREAETDSGKPAAVSMPERLASRSCPEGRTATLWVASSVVWPWTHWSHEAMESAAVQR